MAYEQKPNTGSLFKNDRKESDSHPDYKGSALIAGLGECWLDAWINQAKDGSKYMSLKIKPKEAQRVGGQGGVYRADPATSGFPTTDAYPVDDLDDSIPF